MLMLALTLFVSTAAATLSKELGRAADIEFKPAIVGGQYVDPEQFIEICLVDDK